MYRWLSQLLLSFHPELENKVIHERQRRASVVALAASVAQNESNLYGRETVDVANISPSKLHFDIQY